MIEARLTLPHDAAVASLLETEKFRHKRASYTTSTENGKLIINIEAADATALRTAVNSVARVLAVHEKAKSV